MSARPSPFNGESGTRYSDSHNTDSVSLTVGSRRLTVKCGRPACKLKPPQIDFTQFPTHPPFSALALVRYWLGHGFGALPRLFRLPSCVPGAGTVCYETDRSNRELRQPWYRCIPVKKRLRECKIRHQLPATLLRGDAVWQRQFPRNVHHRTPTIPTVQSLTMYGQPDDGTRDVHSSHLLALPPFPPHIHYHNTPAPLHR